MPKPSEMRRGTGIPNSHPKVATFHKPEVFNPSVQARMRFSPPPVYKPAEHSMQSKAVMARPNSVSGIQSPTWPPVYRPVSPGIQNKTSPAVFRPSADLASEATGANLIGPPVYRPSSIQPKVAGASGTRIPLQTPRIPPLISDIGHMGPFIQGPQVVQTKKGKKKKEGAEKAKTRRIKVNGGMSGGTVELDGDDTNAITSPDGDPNVTNTTSDGEVALLIAALGQFYHALGIIKRKTKNRPKNHTFELEIEGSWGPCDGCKKRLAAFGGLWKAKANSALEAGEEATLTITFTYENPAQEFAKTGGWSTVYGWYGDGNKGPCEHTLTDKAQGA